MIEGLHPKQRRLLRIPDNETLPDALEQLAKDALELKVNLETDGAAIKETDVARIYKMTVRIDKLRLVLAKAVPHDGS